MKTFIILPLALIQLSFVKALEYSSMTPCATLSGTNDLCVKSYESCGKFLTKRSTNSKEVDTYNFGCILTKWCNRKGKFGDQPTIFQCPYGEQDPKINYARIALEQAIAKKGLGEAEAYEDHRFGEDCKEADRDGIIPGAYRGSECKLRHEPKPQQQDGMRNPLMSFNVRTVWDRIGRDLWLLAMNIPFGPLLGLWQLQILPAFIVNMFASMWSTSDELGNNWGNGWFLFAEYIGPWGLYDYYNLYNQAGWWKMFGDWVWMNSFLGPLIEPIVVLIMVATGDLSFGENTQQLTDEEIAAAEEAERLNPTTDPTSGIIEEAQNGVKAIIATVDALPEDRLESSEY